MLEVPPLTFGLIYKCALEFPFLIIGNPIKGPVPFENRTCEIMGVHTYEEIQLKYVR